MNMLQGDLMPTPSTVFDTPPTSVVGPIERFCNGFLLLVASLAALSLGVTMLGLSQAEGLSGPALMAVAVLASAVVITIAALVLIGVFQFNSRSQDGRYERLDFIITWLPLFLFVVVMLQGIGGVLLWYIDNLPNEILILFASEILVLLIILFAISMWGRRKIKTLIAMSCLNNEEAEGLYHDQIHGREDGPGIARENRFSRSTETYRV